MVSGRALAARLVLVTIMSRVLEKTIERNVVNYALKKGIESVKLNGMGKRSHPDRMFLGPRGRVLFIEFKKPGEEPTPLQKHLHKKWKRLGHKVYVVDNVTIGRELIDQLYIGGVRL
jgi:hypothetical protein